MRLAVDVNKRVHAAISVEFYETFSRNELPAVLPLARISLERSAAMNLLIGERRDLNARRTEFHVSGTCCRTRFRRYTFYHHRQ